MPGRLGPRFAVEALFLIALAVGAGYADLATKWIVLIMAGGWLVVALLELTADRIWAAAPPWRRPYYVPVAPPPAEVEAAAPPPAPEPVAAPSPPPPEPEPEPALEEATVVGARLEREPEPEPVPEPAPEPEPEPEPEPAAIAPGLPKLEPLEPRPKRRWFRRREPEEVEVAPEVEPPKHVRLLPSSGESSRVSDEVASIFDEEREGRSRS